MGKAICPFGTLVRQCMTTISDAVLSMTDSSGTCEFPTTFSLKVLSSADDNSDSHRVHSDITKQHRSQHTMCWIYKSLSQRHVYIGTVLRDNKTKVSAITIVSAKGSLEIFLGQMDKTQICNKCVF